MPPFFPQTQPQIQIPVELRLTREELDFPLKKVIDIEISLEWVEDNP